MFLKVTQVLIQNMFLMADKLPFEEGASINRPPLFCGELPILEGKDKDLC